MCLPVLYLLRSFVKALLLIAPLSTEDANSNMHLVQGQLADEKKEEKVLAKAKSALGIPSEGRVARRSHNLSQRMMRMRTEMRTMSARSGSSVSFRAR